MRRVWLAMPMALACSQAPPPDPTPVMNTAVTVTLEALEADSVAELRIRELLESESSLVAPDSFLAEGAIVLADGELRGSAPRLAGVGVGGTLQLVSTRVSSSGAFVWAILEYRWLPMFDTDPVGFGLATLVIGRDRTGTWKVMHLHSSSARPVRERPDATPPDSATEPSGGASP